MNTNTIHQSRPAQIGRSEGMIWIISITFFFAFLDLYFAKLSILPAISIGLLILLITAILLTIIIKMLRFAFKLPEEKTEDGIKRGRFIKKWFLIILAIEIAALNIATFSLLKFHCFQYIVPVCILIVALHFIPLGHIFTMPIYYFLGITLTLVDLLSIFFIPTSLMIGNLIAIIAIPSLSFIFLNWIIVVSVLRDGMRYQRNT
ncbi:MAG TPA: hypothetical protein PKH79_15975 [Prolixibacteraceae bacterium]|nr:hypothetical protein [Prolixibacteraceae bacterium]HPS13346.1 hypothetical protein [Prolixibacteraceae bacterium]